MTAIREPHIIEKASALIIGGELLSGKIRDENIQPLATTLRALGIRLERVCFVSDERDRIAEEVQRLLPHSDILFTSGGVGPTHDDVSVEGVAQALGRPVVLDAELVDLLQQVYGDRLTETHKLMARVPEGAQLLRSHDIRWPTIVCENVWIMPGVPELFRMKLAALREHVRGPTPIYGLELFFSAEEVDLKIALDQVVAAHPQVEIGSYPKWFDKRYKTRVTFDGIDEVAVARAAEALKARLGTLLVEPEAWADP